jgi:hypothetical protein
VNTAETHASVDRGVRASQQSTSTARSTAGRAQVSAVVWWLGGFGWRRHAAAADQKANEAIVQKSNTQTNSVHCAKPVPSTTSITTSTSTSSSCSAAAPAPAAAAAATAALGGQLSFTAPLAAGPSCAAYTVRCARAPSLISCPPSFCRRPLCRRKSRTGSARNRGRGGRGCNWRCCSSCG